MSDETTLLPCPFCGGEAEMCHVTQLWEPRDAYWVKCKNCRISGTHHTTEAEAIAAWNTSATHGMLTAEQVREVVYRNSTYNDIYKVYQVSRTDMQAIADELNSELCGGTCEFVDCGICKFYHADIQLCEYGIPPCSKFERKAVERWRCSE